MRPRRTIIVGGGIAGMALAAAFERLALPYVLLERTVELGEAGSGLGRTLEPPADGCTARRHDALRSARLDGA